MKNGARRKQARVVFFRSTGIAILASLLGLCAAGVANAAFYGDFSDGTISFLGVEDDNGLLGSPTISAGRIQFSPNSGFSATCTNGTCGGGATTTDGLRFQISASATGAPTALVIRLSGDTQIQDDLGLGGIAATFIASSVAIDVFEVDGVVVNNISLAAPVAFDSNGQFVQTTVGWAGNLTVDLSDLLAQNATTGRATRIGFDLSTALTAFSEAGLTASTTLREVEILFIPEPGAAVLIGLGLMRLARRSGS